MSGDYTVGDTLYFLFTTRRFSTGAPYQLAGSPAVSAYENEGLTQITAGITLGVDHDALTGLNLVTVVASGANGFESGKDYHLVVTAGTVDSVSVVGEVVGRFTLERSAAAVDLANETDGLGALKSDTAAILSDTGTDGVVVAAGSKTGYSLTATTGLGNQTANITGNLSGSVGSVTGAVGSVTGLTAATVHSDLDDIQARLPSALTGAGNLKADMLALDGSTDAATNLKASVSTILRGSAITGTLSTTQATTDLTEATNDHYNGRRLIWTSGVLIAQATPITDYDGATKMLTYVALTEAPSNGDTFVIV